MRKFAVIVVANKELFIVSKYSSNAFNEELKRYTAKVELVFAGDETFLAGKYKRNVEISVVAILVDDAWE